MLSRSNTYSSVTVAVAIATAALATPSRAQEYCVGCTSPDVLYRCIIDGAQPGKTGSLPLLCITALAKNGHASCSVMRGVGVIDCNGPVRHVSVPAAGDASAAVATAPPAAVKPVNEGDPQTVEEMLRRAKQKSDRDWAKTNSEIQTNNSEIGNFFKKSWGCVASLFSRCSE
jgi:hypothetical protein